MAAMTNTNTIELKETSRVTITTLVDNYIDTLLPSTDHVRRAPLMKGKVRTGHLLAEHGVSFLIEVADDGEEHTIMFDVGRSSMAVPHNIGVLEVDVAKVEAVVLSHGHFDHVGGIAEVLSLLPRPVDVFVHPYAFTENRIIRFTDGKEALLPPLRREVIDAAGYPIVEVTSSTLLANGYIATLTGIPRVTSFEKGFPLGFIRDGEDLRQDSVEDDQGLVLNVRGKGLVLVTGCGHSGIINTILSAQKTTGIEKIYAVIGGFHLTGPFFEPIIPETVNEMKRFSPQFLLPTHCTGWKAMIAFGEAFPDTFVLNAVGTKLLL
jgi:7,8-dihydropterin-6-yl-methyl-4-(beta-D-ribofuranosyl)aminobenzene 5'-phosphate synthase